MTTTNLLDRDEPIVRDDAIAIVDAALVTFGSRSLVAGHEVVDQLLDLRNALAAARGAAV
jgi:hypothetical protein